MTPTSTPTETPTGTPIPCDLEVTKQCLIEPSDGDLACQAKIAATTLRYIGPDVYGATVQFVSKTGATATYTNVDLISGVTVLAGQNGFTIDAAASNLGDLGPMLDVFINGHDVVNGVDQKLHTSCSTPYVAGQPAPLNNPKGDPSPNWFVENFRDKLGNYVSIPTPPTPSSNCTIDVPEPPHCKGAVKALSLRYLGGDCSQTTNDQYGHVQCSGDADSTAPVRIVVRQGSDIFLDTGSPADVQLGDIVTATAAAAGQQEFPTQTTIEVFDDTNTLLQSLTIYTSCVKPLNLADHFGSVEVTALSTTIGGDVSLGANVTYIYTITNTGPVGVSSIDVVDDVLGTIPGSPIGSISPSQSVTLTTSAFVSENTTNTVTVTGDTAEGQSCGATDTATVTVTPPNCGDGKVEMPETCDPPGYPAGNNGNLCTDGCTSCGDGIVQNGEECDDGNGVDGDGCDNDCTFSVLCNSPTVIDFEGFSAGRIIDEQYSSLGIHVSTVNSGGGPNLGVIFDSSNPTGGDTDLGTPNQDFGGPGVGAGGGAGQPGENSVAQGKVLIIQENGGDGDGNGIIDVPPDDEAGGGTITFTFDYPTAVVSVGVLDIDELSLGTIVALDASNQVIATANMEDFGNNSFQVVTLNALNVRTLKIIFPGSGAVTDLVLCLPEIPTATPTVTATPTASPTATSTKTATKTATPTKTPVSNDDGNHDRNRDRDGELDGNGDQDRHQNSDPNQHTDPDGDADSGRILRRGNADPYPHPELHAALRLYLDASDGSPERDDQQQRRPDQRPVHQQLLELQLSDRPGRL